MALGIRGWRRRGDSRDFSMTLRRWVWLDGLMFGWSGLANRTDHEGQIEPEQLCDLHLEYTYNYTYIIYI